MKRRIKKRKVPDAKAWEGYEADLDVRYAYKLLFGKTTSEVVRHFADARCIERADELLFMAYRTGADLVCDAATGRPSSTAALAYWTPEYESGWEIAAR